MAELGDPAHAAVDVARLMSRTSEQVGRLAPAPSGKGLLYTPSHGYAAFTIPDRPVPTRRPRRVEPPTVG